MNFFRSLDFYPKLHEDTVKAKQSLVGACIFILTVIVMGTLFVTEIDAFLFGKSETEPFITRSNANERIRVNLNMSFYQIPCAAISLDYQDVTGSHFEDIEQTLHKLRLSSDGSFIENAKVQLVRNVQKETFSPSFPMLKKFGLKMTKTGKVSDCYGAELYKGQKCLTCQDVKWAYIMRSWPVPPLEQIAQCQQFKGIGSQYEKLMQDLEKKEVARQIELAEKQRAEILSRQQKEIEEREAAERQDRQNQDLENIAEAQRLAEQQKAKEKEEENTVKEVKGRILHGGGGHNHNHGYGQEGGGITILNQNDLKQLQDSLGEGCQFYGHFYIKKVPGNFHISTHGKGMGLTFFNTAISAAHKINLLEFTTEDGEVTRGYLSPRSNSLDGHDNFKMDIGMDTEYFLKIVTSQYVHPFYGNVGFYEFAQQENTVDRDPRVPKVEFKYDFDPISIRHYKKRRGLLEFIVQLCAIIGGIFAFSTLLSTCLSKD